MKKASLKNFCGYDVCDTVFEYTNYCDYERNYKQSYYDKALDIITDKIEVEGIGKTYSGCILITCNLTAFIEKYQAKINKILKDFYTSHYLDDFNKIKSYKPSKQNNFDGEKSELFYYYYFEGFFNDLLNGNYTEGEYKHICEIFTGKEAL